MEGMPHIPEDIVFNILVRLPKNPILRFRCLSKHWNRLLSDHFMKSRSRRMILLPTRPLHTVDYTNDGPVHSIIKLRCPFNIPPGKDIIVVGTLNGIVLLVFKDDMILYNPFTQVSKIVPKQSLHTTYSSSDAYGFCYGTTPDDLKIVRLRVLDNIDYYRCDVFSLKNWSWSAKLKKFVQWCSISPYGTFVNGFLYWKAISKPFIVALDVKKMVFSEIQLPGPLQVNILGELGGRLHAFRNKGYDNFELWVMNEDGIKKTWTKVLTSCYTTRSYEYFIPISILHDGKIVMFKTRGLEKKVIIYDMFSDSYEIYKDMFSDSYEIYKDMFSDSYEIYKVKANLGGFWRLQAIEYVESLISPSNLCSSFI